MNHAKEAGVPILVAVNKIDKPGANPDIIRNKLSEHGLVSEEWGGETIYVNVSAKTKEGIDKLLEMLALQAEVLELKANPNSAAKGHVVEARLDRARGPISTILVEEGTLQVGELVVAGEFSGKIRAMLGDQGQTLAEAGPSTPVEVLGLDGVPDAGETFNVVEDERAAKSLVEHRRDNRRKKDLAGTTPRVAGEHPRQDQGGRRQGGQDRAQGRRAGLDRGDRERAHQPHDRRRRRQRHLHRRWRHHRVGRQPGQGIVGDHHRLQRPPGGQVAADGRAGRRRHQALPGDLRRHRRREESHGRHAGAGLREKVLGRAEVRQVFTIPKAGTIAGSFVIDGKVTRKAQVRLMRDSVVVFTGKIGSLRRFKDDASEVAQGYECGIGIEGTAKSRKATSSKPSRWNRWRRRWKTRPEPPTGADRRP